MKKTILAIGLLVSAQAFGQIGFSLGVSQKISPTVGEPFSSSKLHGFGMNGGLTAGRFIFTVSGVQDNFSETKKVPMISKDGTMRSQPFLDDFTDVRNHGMTSVGVALRLRRKKEWFSFTPIVGVNFNRENIAFRNYFTIPITEENKKDYQFLSPYTECVVERKMVYKVQDFLTGTVGFEMGTERFSLFVLGNFGDDMRKHTVSAGLNIGLVSSYTIEEKMEEMKDERERIREENARIKMEMEEAAAKEEKKKEIEREVIVKEKKKIIIK